MNGKEISAAFALGLVGGLWILVLGFWGFLSLDQSMVGCALVVAGVPVTWAAWKAFSRERALARLDHEIIDGLLQASALPSSASLSELFAFLANGKWGELSKEFERLNQEILRGRDARETLLDFAKKNNRPVVVRASSLLSIGIASGSDLRDVFRQVARDLLETESILRERQAVLWMQKATLLLSAGILVPGILGSVLSAASQFELGDAVDIGFDQSPPDLLGFVPLAAKGYVIEFALLAAGGAAFLSGKKQDFFLYATVLVPLAWIIFVFSGGG